MEVDDDSAPMVGKPQQIFFQQLRGLYYKKHYGLVMY
jgi:hypothetical protein